MLNGVISYIGIGSNLGDSLANCKEAVAGLSGIPETILEQVSSFYKTEPVTDFPADEAAREVLKNQSWFTNAVAEIRTRLSPRDLLTGLQDIDFSLESAMLQKQKQKNQELPWPEMTVPCHHSHQGGGNFRRGDR